MKKEIELTEDELQQMLKGTLLWSDIAPRLNPAFGGRSGIRQLGTPVASRKTTASSNHSEPSHNNPLYPERNELYTKRQDEHYDIREVQTLLTESKGSYQGILQGAKMIVLLSFAGVAVVSLWLYYFLTV